MKRLKKLFYWLSIALVLMPGCSPYKMKAIRAQRDQRYDLSIKFVLKHLSSNPHDPAAIELLNSAAKGYYDDLEKKIQHFEKLDDWDMVVQVADQGYRTLLEATQIVGIDFPTKEQLSYLQSKSEQSKFKQADELYSEALQHYRDGDFLEALSKFKTVDSYIHHFKDIDQLIADTNQKLASQEYQSASALFNQGRLEEALAGFERTSSYVPNFLDAQAQISEAKTRLAKKYFDEGQNSFNASDYKNAYHTLQKSLSYQPDFSPAKNLFDETTEKLTVRLAVFPFASAKLDQKFGGLVSQNLLARALPRKSEFIMFLEREYLQKIFEEQALSQTGAIDERTAVQVGKLSGVNTIVVGSVTLVSHKDTGPTPRNLTAYYEKKYRDPKGVMRTKKEPFNYIAYEVERSVEVSLSYRLISVETGAILYNESLTEQISDEAEWITCPKEFVSYLAASEQRKMTASQKPKSLDSLVNQAIESLADQAAAKIIRQVSPF